MHKAVNYNINCYRKPDQNYNCCLITEEFILTYIKLNHARFLLFSHLSYYIKKNCFLSVLRYN